MSVSNFVESVEFVDTSIGATSTGTAYNLTKGQNYNNCVPFFTTRSNTTYMDARLVDIYFSGTTESGTIHFQRDNTRSTEVDIKCYVVEFNPDEVRVQQGVFDVSTSSTHEVSIPTTLSGVDRAAMTFSWRYDGSSGEGTASLVRGRVLTTSGIDFYRYAATDGCLGHWFLFEDRGNNFRVVHGSSTMLATSLDKSIHGGNQVDHLRFFLLGSYAAYAGNSRPYYWTAKIYLNTDGSVACRKGTSASNIYWSYQIFTFLDKSKIYTPFEHYSFFQSSSNSIDRVIGGDSGRVPFFCNMDTSSVVTSSMGGMSSIHSSSTSYRTGFFSTVYLSASGTLSYGGYSSVTKRFPYSVAVDWAGIDVDTGVNYDPIPVGSGINQSFVKSVENFRMPISESFGAHILTKGQDPDNCAVFASSHNPSGGQIKDCTAEVYVVSPGVVCAKSGSDDGIVVDVSTVEFWPSQVNVQQKRVHVNSSDSTVPVDIATVSALNKAFILSSYAYDEATNLNTYLASIKFTSTSGIEVHKHATSVSMVDASFFVVEDLGNNFEVYHESISFSSTIEYLITNQHWPYNESFIICSYTGNSADNDPYRNYISASFHSEYLPVKLHRNATNNSIYAECSIIRFLDGRVHVNHAYIELPANNNPVSGEYSSELTHENAITCYNVSQNSTVKTHASHSTYTSQGFCSAKLTDSVGDYSYMVERTTSCAYDAWAGVDIIDWVGINNQTEKYIPTRGMFQSLRKEYQYTDSSYIKIDVGRQRISQCVPFVVNASSTDASSYLCYKAVYRYENPDYFVIRFPDTLSSDRHFICYIVEFDDNVTVQYGSFSTTGTSETVGISPVNLDRSFLVFYSYTNYQSTSIFSRTVCGSFVDSSSIKFERHDSSGQLCVSWYVVECSDTNPYWEVDHYYDGTSRTGTTIYEYLSENLYDPSCLVIASWKYNSAESDPNDNLFHARISNTNAVVFRRYSGAGGLSGSNVEVVRIKKDLGFRCRLVEYDFSGGSNDVALQDQVDVVRDRSMVISLCQLNESSINTSTPSYRNRGFHYYEFKDPETVTVHAPTNTSVATMGSFGVYEWPEVNKYYVEGYVKELDVPVSRVVHLYRTSTGEIVDSTTSISGSGYFFLETPFYEKHHVVGFDNDSGIDYNALIYSDVYPTIISGTFSYYQGWSTISGVDIPVGVPLGRL